jgi:hypothetical protein
VEDRVDREGQPGVARSVSGVALIRGHGLRVKPAMT